MGILENRQFIKKRILLFCILISVLMITWGCSEKKPVPKAARGVLNLSQWDFVRNGPANLEGEWEFYWGKLLTPEDFQGIGTDEKKQYINLPNLWKSSEINGRKLPPKGFATYRLTVKVKPDETQKALMTSRPLSVCKVWVNGRLLGQTGQVGKDMETEVPRRHTLFHGFANSRDEITVILQVSNFHNNQGGMIDSIRIGSEEQLRQSTQQKYVIIALLGGALFITGLFHLTLFAIRQSEPANLYFGLYCIMQSASKMAGEMGVCLMPILIPGLPWRMTVEMSLVPEAPCIPLLVMFYHALFPYKHSRIAERFYMVIGAAFLGYLVLTPLPNAFDFEVLIFLILGLTAFPYLFFRFVLDLIRGKEGARFLVPGYLILLFAGVNDLLLESHFLETVQLVPFAMLFFIISYSFLISIRYSHAFTHLKALSSELEEKNIELFRQIRKKESARQREIMEKSEKLRYQFNPHFLFNALTSIRGAISRDRDAARNMVSHLSEFCRLALSMGHMDILTVDREIETIRHYLAMERMRMGDYLSVSVEVEPPAGKMKVPAFILHPIVENAVKYGSRTSPDILELTVRVTAPAAGALRVLIFNTGRWVDPETADETASTGTGLKNVRQRLAQYYGDAHGFEIRGEEGRVCIRIDLPDAPLDAWGSISDESQTMTMQG